MLHKAELSDKTDEMIVCKFKYVYNYTYKLIRLSVYNN